MQKYNDPLPGRHGYLANPPFYGSTLVEAATASNRESVGNQSQQAPSLNGDFLFIKRRPIIQGTLNPAWDWKARKMLIFRATGNQAMGQIL